MKTILFPCDYFHENKPDSNYLEEYRTVLYESDFEPVLFSYDEFVENRTIKTNRILKTPVSAIYRGWMMKSEMYADFYNRLRKNNIFLITPPDAYRKMHEFPYIYSELGSDTAQMLIYNNPDEVDIREIRAKFHQFMIKDYVKSVKNTDFPVCLSADIDEWELHKRLQQFLSYRGTLYTGGICIKEYLNLKKYGNKTNEYRVFYINGSAATVSRNSGQAEYVPQPPKELIMKYQNLSSPFYTVDYAQLTDESWKIIETGDGQVSGLSDNQDIRHFYRMLSVCTENFEFLQRV